MSWTRNLKTLAAGRLVESRLFGVGSADPATIAGAVVPMVAVALIAALLPAIRASRIEPAMALRLE